jgi:hypothetical protein
MQFTIRHTIDTDADTFWDRIFFDEEFNRALCADYLRFEVFRVLSFNREDSGVITRRIENQPRAEIPRVVKKALGDSTGFVEEGRFDPERRRWVFRVIPHVASSKIQTTGELWVEERGEKKAERVVTVDNRVKVFGVGRLVEELIEKQTRDNYDKAAAFTNRWIREKGL